MCLNKKKEFEKWVMKDLEEKGKDQVFEFVGWMKDLFKKYEFIAFYKELSDPKPDIIGLEALTLLHGYPEWISIEKKSTKNITFSTKKECLCPKTNNKNSTLHELERNKRWVNMNCPKHMPNINEE